MPLVITCPRCHGNGTISLGMTWEEAINLAERIRDNPKFKLEAVMTKHYEDKTFFVVTVTDAVYRNTIYDVTGYSHYLLLCEDLKRKEKESNATSGNTHDTTNSSK